MEDPVITPEDVLQSLMSDGTIDALRLKIINQLKANVLMAFMMAQQALGQFFFLHVILIQKPIKSRKEGEEKKINDSGRDNVPSSSGLDPLHVDTKI